MPFFKRHVDGFWSLDEPVLVSRVAQAIPKGVNWGTRVETVSSAWVAIG